MPISVSFFSHCSKLPTQRFFTDTFGLPLTMNPNFEDLSCEMIFGQAPPEVHMRWVGDGRGGRVGRWHICRCGDGGWEHAVHGWMLVDWCLIVGCCDVLAGGK
jgi:hypothetical protein